jgi:hypothetical protein
MVITYDEGTLVMKEHVLDVPSLEVYCITRNNSKTLKPETLLPEIIKNTGNKQKLFCHK